MHIITRYICRRVLMYYLGLIVMMLAFFVFVDFMEHIERLTRRDASPALLSLYYACLSPRIVVEVSWISFLVAVLFVLGGLVKHNELAALLSGGISAYGLMIPLLVIGVFLYGIVFLTQELVLPVTMLRASELDESDFKIEGGESTFFDLAGISRRNLFYYFDVADTERGILSKVHIHKMVNGSLIERIDAEEAVWDDGSKRWFLRNGTVKKFDAEGTVIESAPFSEMKAPIKESPKALKLNALEGAELSSNLLRRQIRNLEKSGYDARRLKIQYYSKFALPAANVIVLFLALPFALECRRGGLAFGIALSLSAALLYYGTFQVGITLGRGGALPAMLAVWLANVLFFGIGAILTLKART